MRESQLSPNKSPLLLMHYGLQAGQTVGVLSSQKSGENDITQALRSFGCHPLLLDRHRSAEELAAEIGYAGVKLVFAAIEDAHVFDHLRVCVAYVQGLTLSGHDGCRH
jgi:hypothetical protein